MHAYREVGWSIVLEAGGRLVSGLLLVAAGLGVTGAYLGTPVSMAVTAVVLIVISHRRIGVPDAAQAATRLRDLVAGAWPAVIGLFLVAVLQNVDVILVKRTIGGDAAGAYAAAAVAAKAVVWVAIGVGLYLLPEATRKARAGEDPRPVLLRALGVVAVVAVPMLVVYAVAPSLVLRLAFGEETVQASGALLVLGFAMTLLAAGYLCVQYMLALREMRFLIALGVAAAAEIAVLSGTGLSSIVGFATVVLGAAGGGGADRARARARPPARPDRGGPGVSEAPEGWLTGAQAERLRARRGRGGSRHDRRDRLLPRALHDRARRRGRARARASSRSTPTPARTAGRRRSTPTRCAATPTTPRSGPTSRAAGVAERVRHVRKMSAEALGDVEGPLALLYVDGAHRFGPARDDVAALGRARRARRHDARARLVLLDRRHRRAAGRVRRARGLALRRPHGLAGRVPSGSRPRCAAASGRATRRASSPSSRGSRATCSSSCSSPRDCARVAHRLGLPAGMHWPY